MNHSWRYPPLPDPPASSSSSSHGPHHGRPPSFAESQYHTIVRRQRKRRTGSLKVIKDKEEEEEEDLDRARPSDAFRFAGWGAMSTLELDAADFGRAEARLEAKVKRAVLGQWRGTAISGNDLLGSVFYAFPAVIAVASVYSPLTLFVASLMLLPWRWIMPELASAFCDNASNYAYLSNSSNQRTLAVIAASATLVDYVATAVVGSASGAAYLAGEVALEIKEYWITALILVGVAILSLCGLKESTNMAFAVIVFHALTMCMLAIAAVVAWSKTGSDILVTNWHETRASGAADILRGLFYGISLGALGCTGLEIVASQVQELKPGSYPKILRNLYIAVICLNGPLMLLVWAVLPADVIASSTNILSVLAEQAAGKWLRIWVVVDAMAVLCSDVLTGIVPVCGLFERLVADRVLPVVMTLVMPRTGSRPIMITSFALISIIFLLTTSADLAVESDIFSLSFLSILAVYVLSSIMLKVNRSRLVRSSVASWTTIMLAILVLLFVLAGTVAQGPITLAYWSGWFGATFLVLSMLQRRVELHRWLTWTLYSLTPLRRFKWYESLALSMIAAMKSSRSRPVIYFVKTDEISTLMHAILYVQANESSGHVQLIHIYDSVHEIPSELEANHRLLDEAFPNITIDLIFLQGRFDAVTVEAIGEKCQVSKGLMFANCPGPRAQWRWNDLGIRLI